MSEIDFGPLQVLIGTWKGDRGTDVAPEPDGKDETPFFETIEIEAVGDVTNAKKQTLVVVRYHQVVSRKSNNEVFHDEIGYWYWDADSETVAHSLTIPRAVCVLAGGTVKQNGDEVEFQVSAKDGDRDWGIVQSPFMRDNARTVEFRHNIKVSGDTLAYSETTVLDIYGKTFDHTDENTLQRS